VPFFISGLYIMMFLAKIKRANEAVGKGFDLREFRMGTAHLGLGSFETKKEREGAGAKVSQAKAV